MRTISKTSKAKKQCYGIDVKRAGKQPPEMNADTWPSLINVDLIKLPGKSPAAATVADNPTRHLGRNQNSSDQRTRMVALSDGTQVIFAKLGQFTVV